MYVVFCSSRKLERVCSRDGMASSRHRAAASKQGSSQCLTGQMLQGRSYRADLTGQILQGSSPGESCLNLAACEIRMSVEWTHIAS